MGHQTASVSGGGEESTRWVGRGQYLSVMKLSIHVDLSLCDEARQVWDWVGDICKEMHWSQCRHGPHLHPIRATWVLFPRDGICGGEEKTVNSLMDEQSYCTSMQKTVSPLSIPVGKEGSRAAEGIGQ